MRLALPRYEPVPGVAGALRKARDSIGFACEFPIYGVRERPRMPAFQPGVRNRHVQLVQPIR